MRHCLQIFIAIGQVLHPGTEWKVGIFFIRGYIRDSPYAKPQSHEAALINADYEWEPIMIELLQLPDIAATVSVAHQLPTPR